MNDLTKLTKKRGSLRKRLTDFGKLIESKLSTYTDPQTMPRTEILAIESRLSNLASILSEFEILQEQIDEIREAENPNYSSDDLEVFETDYYDSFGKAKFLLESQIGAQVKNSDSGIISQTCSTPSSELKLPKISLPKFSGQITKWLEFRDMFEALVDKSTKLNNIQKLYYLRASLCGEAAHIVGSLETSSSNYEVAWNLICNRFENKRVLIQNHVRSLFSIQVIKKESAGAIRDILDTISINVRALLSLGQPVDMWDTVIIVVISNKLDDITQREWENHTRGDLEFPSLVKFKEFLQHKAIMLDNLNLTKHSIQNTSQAKPQPIEDKHRFKVMHVSKITCYYCKGNHAIYNCKDFQHLSLDERWKQVNLLNLCQNCLRIGHELENCKLGGCKFCDQKHNSYLHKNQQPSQAVTLCASLKQEPYLLPTAIVGITETSGATFKVRALLDSGATSNFITLNVVRSLKIPMKSLALNASCFGNIDTEIIGQCQIRFKSMISPYNDQAPFLVVREITSYLPQYELNTTELYIPHHFLLADPNFSSPTKVDILLGSAIFADSLTGNSYKLGPNKPKLLETLLGWVVLGKTDFLTESLSSQVQCNFTKIDTFNEIQQQLSKFWEIEECTNDKNQEMQPFSEKHFLENYHRTVGGRFVVGIPFNKPLNLLGDSKQIAFTRFLSYERKLHSNLKLKQPYINFMREYEELGHMTKLIDVEENLVQYFLPHHGVCNEASTTTKLRVVFDASCKTSSGHSLNSIQAIGPQLQQDLFSILVRFRQHSIAVSADVSKMYRQVLVRDEDKPLQQILWREHPADPLQIYQLNTVTYGTSAAPFLAIRCLHELGKQSLAKNQSAAQVILQDFYVDDMLSGGENLDDVLKLTKDVTSILASGCFPLRKFNSNSRELLLALGNDSQVGYLNLGENENTKTLGLHWHTVEDTFVFNISDELPDVITKRTILSMIGQIFDPLGLLGACTITAKLFLQDLWQQKVGWDDPLPNNLVNNWVIFQTNLTILNFIKIPRNMLSSSLRDNIQLHGFADASEKAYGACVYIKCSDKVNLIASKSRVAPLKALTIPRLELCAALLLTNLVNKITEALELNIQEVYLWSDSTIVLHWLQKSRHEFKQFVANRVGQIQDGSKNYIWRYVPSKQNSADLVSRGVTPETLLTSQLWWHGPEFLLSESENAWPNNVNSSNNPSFAEIELKPTNLVFVTTMTTNLDVINKFSDIARAKRVIAYCLRFINKCRRINVIMNRLTTEEVQSALLALIKGTQLGYYETEIKVLQMQKSINRTSKILLLNPFLDDFGLLRVGGRLQFSNLRDNQKHSIILPPKCHLSLLLFRNAHLRLLHAGPLQILYSLREYYWPIHGMSLAKQVVRNCIKCFRNQPVNAPTPLMGSLPKQRVTVSYPFLISGVDYAGPFVIKCHKGRTRKTEKAYVCLFICFATKAVHIEIVPDLTSDAFIAGLKRFISRRGKPRELHSDNGTNFVGANKELLALTQLIQKSEIVNNFFVNEDICWKFIPPRAPHFGGLWESNIKRVKFHMKRIIGDKLFTFEELSTLTCQIEAILNSRPLTQLSEDPNDVDALTPSHFLIGRRLTNIAEPSYADIADTRCSTYQTIQKMFQHFWNRWSKEYLSNLQVRSKWKCSGREIKVGDLVIIKDENVPPLRWPLGRVEDLIVGKDGIARVASVRIRQNSLRRPVVKLFPLPLEE